MKTIAKNRKRLIDSIFAHATGCTCHSLDGGQFKGFQVVPATARTELALWSFAKLMYCGKGQYLVRVHGNLWYYVYSPVLPDGSMGETNQLSADIVKCFPTAAV